MNDDKIWNLFEPLFSDIKKEDEFYSRQPLLAHYTSLTVLESILAKDEIWFSNPLFMNDFEEVRFGIIHGARVAKESEVVRRAFETEARYTTFTETLDHIIDDFDRNHLLDTYVFCLSEHSPEDVDGLLSMWRGYGGNGKGAAIVIDTSKIATVDESPLLILKVQYGSSDQRFGWIEKNASVFAEILTRNHIPDDKIYLASAQLFERLKLFALTTKHHGFREEREWRIVYLSDRDDGNKLKFMQHYLNGPRGIEPKFRFKVEPIEGVTPPDLSFDRILAGILLGPSTSSPLAARSVERMLDLIGKPELKNRLCASSIPFRAL